MAFKGLYTYLGIHVCGPIAIDRDDSFIHEYVGKGNMQLDSAIQKLKYVRTYIYVVMNMCTYMYIG